MWHIMEKFPEKVGGYSSVNDENSDFWPRLNACVWGSETGEEFESDWNSLMSEYGLDGNEWIQNRYRIREEWIPAYYMDVPLAGVLRTTSRSESANGFFSHFIHRKLSFVEFWLRFETALEWQRQEELKADNKSIHSAPQLKTSWPMEKQGSVLYTHEVFLSFQKEVVAARDHCWVQNITLSDEMKIVTIGDGRKKDRDIHVSMMPTCSCKLFLSRGIPCRHIILVLRGEKQVELPVDYYLQRWEKRCKRYWNTLDDKILESNDPAMRKKIANVRNKFEDLIRKANNSEEGMDFLLSGISNLEAPLDQMTSPNKQSKQDEYEAFIGCHIPNEMTVHPPTDICSKGRSKRIKKSKEVNACKKKGKVP